MGEGGRRMRGMVLCEGTGDERDVGGVGGRERERCEGCGCPGSQLVVGSIWAYMCPLEV